MEYNAKTLLNKIDDYFTGKISKTDLGEWSKRAYYDLLRGGYIENEKITIYPFLKVISTFHLKDNDMDDSYPCTEESIRLIRNILYGKQNFDFSIELSIPMQLYSMFKERDYLDEKKRIVFAGLRNALNYYFEQKTAFNDEIVTQIKSVMCLKQQNMTVLDLLENYIHIYLKILFDNKINESELQNCFRLYGQKSSTDGNYGRLLNYLDCYIGNRNFQLLVSYKDGKSSILLSL